MGYSPGILTLKMFDIFLLTVYYFLIAFYMSAGLDYIMGKYDSNNDKNKPTWQLLLECITFIFFIMIAFYIARNLVERIPFPFEGLWGFKHERVKERGGDVVFIFLIFFHQDFFTKKLKFLYKRIIGDYRSILDTKEQKPIGDKKRVIKSI